MKIAAHLALCVFALCQFHATASIGDDAEKSNTLYGELVRTRDDVFNSQNTDREYRSLDGSTTFVTFDRHGHAVEIIFCFPKGTYSERRVNELLAPNGTGWTKQRPPLGSAMNTDKPDVWISAEGRRAELRRDPTATGLVIYTPERLAERASGHARMGVR